MSNEQTVTTENKASGIPLAQQTVPANPGIGPKMSSIQDLINQAWPMYTANIKKMIGIILIPLLAFIVLAILTGILVAIGFVIYKASNEMLMPLLVVSVLLALVMGLAFIAICVISQAGMFILIKDSKENITVKEALLRAKKIAGKFFLLNLLIGFFVLLWSLLFIIPGIYMALAYSMAVWVFIYDGFVGSAAIKKSKEMVKGFWWPVFIRYAAVYMIMYIVIFIPTMIFAKNGSASIIWSIFSQILSFLAAPFFVIYSNFIYWDLKKIKNI